MYTAYSGVLHREALGKLPPTLRDALSDIDLEEANWLLLSSPSLHGNRHMYHLI